MKRGGFTVMEVLIALAIFVGMATVLGATYLNILNAYSQIDEVNDFQADVKFARSLLLTEPDLDTAEKGGEFDTPDGRHLTWQVSVDPTETTDLFAVTFECDLNGPDLKQPVQLTEHFRLLRPTWSKQEDHDKLRAAAQTRIQQLQTSQGGGS